MKKRTPGTHGLENKNPGVGSALTRGTGKKNKRDDRGDGATTDGRTGARVKRRYDPLRLFVFLFLCEQVFDILNDGFRKSS